MNEVKNLGSKSLTVKRNFRKLKLIKYKNAREMAKDLHISENYIYQIISMKTDKVPSIPLLEFISDRWNMDITYFFEENPVIQKNKKVKTRV